jgi:hypothetical protein
MAADPSDGSRPAYDARIVRSSAQAPWNARPVGCSELYAASLERTRR